ncbi:lysophospholipid acyltransferase family protein [Actinomadura keratinilytica]
MSAATPEAAPRTARPVPRAGALLRRLLWWCVLTLTGGVERRGALPPGGCVVVANHTSHADTAALLATLDARHAPLIGAAADYWFASPWRRRICGRLAAGFPVRRTGGGLGDLLERAAELRAGRAVVLFPEGTRGGGDGRLGTFHRGRCCWPVRRAYRWCRWASRGRGGCCPSTAAPPGAGAGPRRHPARPVGGTGGGPCGGGRAARPYRRRAAAGLGRAAAGGGAGRPAGTAAGLRVGVRGGVELAADAGAAAGRRLRGGAPVGAAGVAGGARRERGGRSAGAAPGGGARSCPRR